jgi:putative inorganic carbon (HCO3(-)) transporter
VSVLVKQVTDAVKSPKGRSKFAYRMMLVFSFLYYFRPGEIIPGLGSVPLAKITGGIALLGLLLGTSKGRPKKLPVEVKVIFALFGWLILTIPFAYWRGGSLGVVFWEFSKAVIIALTLSLTVSYLFELRRLIFVQAFGVALMTIVSVLVNHRMQGRLAGIGQGLLSNPNDLAMNIALNWPLCLAFLLAARGLLKKMFWGFSMLVMIYAVMATYSRAGFMALALAIVMCLWEFGVRGKRFYMLAGAVLCGLVLIVVVPQNYSKRLETLIGRFQEGDQDRGSAEARKELLVKSLEITITHPVFGVGPGNFAPYTRLWRVTHNTYTEFSSECGIPGLVLFLGLLWRAFRSLRYVRKAPRSRENTEMHLYASAVWAGLVAYLLGAFFASTAYDLFPYYMITYATLLYKLAAQQRAGEPVTVVPRPVLVPERIYSPV